MSLSELHDPKVAAELIADFKKRFKTKVCMAPYDDHQGRIVSAHTLSVRSMLSQIARDSHVYGASVAKEMSREKFPIEIKLMGVREVSVFNGFCKKHDAELFHCLDDEPFRFTRKQLFMLAYRGVVRECYLKRKQADSLPSPDTYAKMHGINEKLTFSDQALLYQAASLRGAEEAESLKATLDKRLRSQAWGRLVNRAILFPHVPSVLATAAFQPFFDMDGNQLQNFEDLEAEMSQVCMSVIPVEEGGAAIFSWLDTDGAAPERFFRSVANAVDKTSAVIHAVMDNTENFALSPNWYDALSKEQQAYIFGRVINFEGNGHYSTAPRPEVHAPDLDDWGKPQVVDYF